ncbi:MAG: DUF1320 domain-containing protein [Pseudomonadota bacterium]|nr:DUF1320 domain-containing protein [Pseudomonadota bacterium]
MYATRDDLIDRFGATDIQNLERRLSADKQPDPSISERAIADAEEEANSYISVRHTLPLSVVPEVLRRAICDMARYALYTNTPLDEVTKRYELALTWLKRVADGKVILMLPVDNDGQQEEVTQNGQRVAVGVSHYGGVFGKATTDKMPTL